MHLYFDQNNKLVFNPSDIVMTSDVDPDALSLASRMAVVGETPTDVRFNAINNCIISLRSNNLWTNQFDVFVTTRSHGRNSAKMNWIKNASNATESSPIPTFTANVGFNSNGSSSYLIANYIPSTQGVLYKLNDCSFGFKDGGSVVPAASTGGHGTPYNNCCHIYYNVARINETIGTNLPSFMTTGYTIINRTSSSSGNVIKNATLTNIITSTTSLPSSTFEILRTYAGSYYYCNVERINEMYWMGKNMSQSKFNIFQSIMNTYFGTF